MNSPLTDQYDDPRRCDRSDLGHAWFEVDDPGTWSPARTFFHRDVHRCLRCRAYRFRGLDTYGRIQSTWYSYPDNWRDRWGVGRDRPPGDEIRKERMLREQRERRATSAD